VVEIDEVMLVKEGGRKGEGRKVSDVSE